MPEALRHSSGGESVVSRDRSSVSEVGQAGDTVTVNITAQQTSGSSTSYTGYYTVDNGKITSGHITQS